jgi:fructose-1-phosphate kinase PfkB-like protein
MRKKVALISFNPLLDISLREEDYSFREKKFAKYSCYAAGGLAINVARGLKCLEKSFKLYTILGGDIGRLVKKQLVKEGIPFGFLEDKGETRVAVVWDGHKRNMFVAPSPAIDFSTIKKFISNYYSEISGNDLVVIGGSVPEKFSDYICENLIRKLKTQGVKVIVDSRGLFAQRVFKEVPYIIRYNKKKASYLQTGPKINQCIKEACDLHKKGTSLVILNTRKHSYAIHSHNIWRYPSFTQFSMNTFGRGDAFLAGLISAHLDGYGFNDAVRFAIACGASFACDFPLGNIFTKSVPGYFCSIQNDWKRKIR